MFIINPGHGLTDPGGVGNGYLEKNIVLSISWLLGGILTHAGKRVDIQREGDSFIPLNMIGEDAKRSAAGDPAADTFVSIHTDANRDPGAHGCTVYYYPGDTRSAAIAKKVVDSLSVKMGFANRGARAANFQVLRDTWKAMPSILVECAFITNKTDAAILASLTGQWYIANGIAGGLLN